MGIMVVLLGLAVLFQFIIVRIKWNRGNYIDVVVDLGLLFILNIFFGGTILGVVSATAGSTLISLYLIWYPIKLQILEGESPTTSTANGNTTASQQPSDIFARFDRLFE